MSLSVGRCDDDTGRCVGRIGCERERRVGVGGVLDLVKIISIRITYISGIVIFSVCAHQFDPIVFLSFHFISVSFSLSVPLPHPFFSLPFSYSTFVRIAYCNI